MYHELSSSRSCWAHARVDATMIEAHPSAMKELRTEIAIGASPEAVWAILTNFAAFPQWNPFIREASGEQKVGGKLRIHIVPPGGKGMVFTPTLLAFETNRELRWLGRLGVPGLFDGEHGFTLEPIDGGQTKLTQREVFTGVLVPLFARSLDDGTRKGFEAMNLALKERAEKNAASR
jgi:hypothetical protein